MQQAAPYVVPSARNAARIVRRLAQAPDGLRLVEIARELGINTSTCLNILRTLVDEGFVDLASSGRSYRLGLGLLGLMSEVLERGDAQRLVRPLLERLAARYGMTAILWRRDADGLEVLLSASPPGVIGLSAPEGARTPLLAGSVGRVIAAFGGLPVDELRRRFAEVDWQAPLSFEDYMAQVDETQEQGWAVDRGELQRNIVGLAAPVLTAAPVQRVLCLAAAASELPKGDEIGEVLARVGRALGRGAAPEL
jgi:DNA-binding IclR family transcriptional regulator